MIIKFSVENEKDQRNHFSSYEMKGYYWGYEELLKDFEKVIELHKFRKEEWDRNYIKQWGQDQFDEHILGVKK